MTGSFKSRLARGQRRDGRRMGFHTPPSRQPHPWMRRIQRSGPRPRRLSLSFLFVGSAALRRPLSSLSTPHPPLSGTGLPQKTPQPPLIFFLDTFEHGLPPPFLAPDRRRSGPTAHGGRRSKPGRRCFRTFLAFFLLVLAFSSCCLASGRSAGGWIGLSSWVRGPGG